MSFKLFAIHPPIHTLSIAILACDSFGPDKEKVGDLNKRGKWFLELFELLECFWSVNHLWHLPRTPKLNVIKIGRTVEKNVMDGVWMGGGWIANNLNDTLFYL